MVAELADVLQQCGVGQRELRVGADVQAVRIAGERVTGDDSRAVVSPFDGTEVGRVPVLGRAEVDRAVPGSVPWECARGLSVLSPSGIGARRLSPLPAVTRPRVVLSLRIPRPEHSTT